MRHQRFWSLGLFGCLATVLTLLGVLPGLPSLTSYAQRSNIQPSYISAEQIATRFYQQVPNFPRADTYKTTNPKITVPSTLAERLVLYHTLVKGRSPQRRFDWKLTLADFMGMNDPISPQSYPGREYLDRNPLEEDRTLIRQFNRQQRNQLVQTLVDLYTPVSAKLSPPPANSSSTATPVSPVPTQPTPRIPPLPQGGGANLLIPPAPSGVQAPRPAGDARLLLP